MRASGGGVVRNIGHLGYFSNALADLRAGMPAPEAKMLAEMLLVAGRFYMPADVNITKGKIVTFRTGDESWRLPYGVTAVLSETHVEGAPTHMITFGVHLDSPENLSHKWIPPSERRGYAVLSALKHPAGKFWLPIPISVFVEFHLVGYTVSVFRPRSAVSDAFGIEADKFAERAVRELSDDTSRLANLSALLNCSNVTTEKAQAPKGWAKSRAKKGKPLLDYHVLCVGGDVWNEAGGCADSHDGGFRSHKRRGHIRRLPTGRDTWVSSCFVHGSREGFVAKEYRPAIINRAA